MPDETNTNAQKPAAPTKVVEDRGGYSLELTSFTEGNNKGFKFWNIEFKTLDDAIKHFTAKNNKGEKGESIILALVNSAMSFRMRSQANNRLIAPNDKGVGGMDPKEKLERLNAGGDRLIILSQEDAETYVPGQRELESISGLIKAKINAAKQIKDAKSKNNGKLVLELLGKYKELDARIKELQEKEEAKLLEGIDEIVISEGEVTPA